MLGLTFTLFEEQAGNPNEDRVRSNRLGRLLAVMHAWDAVAVGFVRAWRSRYGSELPGFFGWINESDPAAQFGQYRPVPPSPASSSGFNFPSSSSKPESSAGHSSFPGPELSRSPSPAQPARQHSASGLRLQTQPTAPAPSVSAPPAETTPPARASARPQRAAALSVPPIATLTPSRPLSVPQVVVPTVRRPSPRYAGSKPKRSRESSPAVAAPGLSAKRTRSNAGSSASREEPMDVDPAPVSSGRRLKPPTAPAPQGIASTPGFGLIPPGPVPTQGTALEAEGPRWVLRGDRRCAYCRKKDHASCFAYAGSKACPECTRVKGSCSFAKGGGGESFPAFESNKY